MHDEHEKGCVGLPNAIEHENGLHGEVPGACAVGRRNKHGERSDHERNEGCQRAETCREVETEEGEVEVQVVAHPNAYGIEDKEQRTLHFTNGKQSALQVGKHGMSL